MGFLQKVVVVQNIWKWNQECFHNTNIFHAQRIWWGKHTRHNPVEQVTSGWFSFFQIFWKNITGQIFYFRLIFTFSFSLSFLIWFPTTYHQPPRWGWNWFDWTKCFHQIHFAFSVLLLSWIPLFEYLLFSEDRMTVKAFILAQNLFAMKGREMVIVLLYLERDIMRYQAHNKGYTSFTKSTKILFVVKI